MWTIILAVGLALAVAMLVGVFLVGARRSGRQAARAQELAARASGLEREHRVTDSILSSLDDGMVLLDDGLRIVYKNDRADTMFPGLVDDDVMPSSLRETVDRVRSEKSAEVVEVEDPGGRVIGATVVPVPGDGHVLLVLRDVTAARRLEAIRRDFVANASHELKTPAAAVQALAETIQQAAREDPGALASFSVQLSREAERLSRIIADLLDLSRLESEAGERTDVRLDRLVAEEAGRLKDRAEDAGLSFAIDTDGHVAVRGSPRDLALLVRNLLENAIQYTRPGGRVEVSVSSEDGSAGFRVRDSGIGIPSPDQAWIFERFYRVDRARSRDTGGTGLGLSIVKHVCAYLGGTVSVDSHLGRGSTFTVRLPLGGAGASAGDS